ncbi:MAG: glycosyl transferase, partial [Eubacterium sp.]|nr:glycosyl transferase [Eubacterium sp.]
MVVRASYTIIPDEIYIKWIFRRRMGYKLNLKNPQTFSEKLQWIKLYDRNPLYTTIVDKYAAKDYISSKIGSKYVIPTIGVWDKFEDIDFSKLPQSFVLKTTHDSGGVVICQNKDELNVDDARKKLTKSLKHNFYLNGREWPYKNVPRRIIAEEYLEDKKTKELRDYKFFGFNGRVKAMFVATDRQKRPEPCFDFFDESYNHLD